jgi:release factor glutamine methyltransferase
LKPGGRLYFEINPLKADDMKLMLATAGYHNVELRSDIFGKLRLIKAEL